jgi:hypothetical protein
MCSFKLGNELINIFRNASIGTTVSIQAAAKRCPKKKFNPDLQYSEVDFRCVHGGKHFKSQSKGIRPNQQYVNYSLKLI